MGGIEGCGGKENIEKKEDTRRGDSKQNHGWGVLVKIDVFSMRLNVLFLTHIQTHTQTQIYTHLQPEKGRWSGDCLVNER